MAKVVKDTAVNRAILKRFGIDLREELERREGETPEWMSDIIDLFRPRRQARRSGRSEKVSTTPSRRLALAEAERRNHREQAPRSGKPMTAEEFERSIDLGLAGAKEKVAFAEKLYCMNPRCGGVFYDTVPLKDARRREVLCPYCFKGHYTPSSVMWEGSVEPAHWRDAL